MKQCPVCHAIAFDDAAICYGCLHRFVEEDEVLRPEQLGQQTAAPEGSPVCEDEPSESTVVQIPQVAPPSSEAGHVVVPVEVASEGGTWMVRVEVWGTSGNVQQSRPAPKGRASRAVLRRQKRQPAKAPFAHAGAGEGVR